MTHHKNLSSLFRHAKIESGFVGLCENRDIFAGTDIVDRYFCVAGMRGQKLVIEASHKRDLAVVDFVPEQPEFLLRKHPFLQSVEMIQTRLGSPAEEHRGGNVCVRPVHDLCQFIPVVNFFKFHLLDRCTGDDHTVVIIFPHILKFHIERVQMAGRCIFRLVACHHQKGDINLQGGVGKGAQKLQLGIFFERHQIQDHNLQRTDVLMNRSCLVHDEYIFAFEYFFYR